MKFIQWAQSAFFKKNTSPAELILGLSLAHLMGDTPVTMRVVALFVVPACVLIHLACGALDPDRLPKQEAEHE
jgi:hypothetical protein